MMRKNLKQGGRMLLLALVIALLIGGMAQAAEDSRELSTIVVTAQGEQEPGVDEIDTEKLQRNLATDMKDVFRSESSIEIGGGSRAAQRIYVRGIEASNLNVTIDGASQGMNHFQHRGNIGGISVDLLKKVEVQTMQTADQGAGALAGSIRFETVDAQDLLPAENQAGAIMRGGYSSVDRGQVIGGSVFGRAGEHLGLLLNYSESDFDAYKDGDGNRIVGSDGEDTNLFFKLSLLELAGHSLRFSVENHQDEGLYTGDWTYGDGTARTPTHQISERDTYTFEHRFTSQSNHLINWKFNAYHSEESLDRSGTETISDSLGIDMRNISRFAIGKTDHALTYGVDWSNEEGEEVGDVTNIEVENLGIYLQNRVTVSRFLLSFGARFDNYDTTFRDVDINGDEISPNVGAEVNMGLGFTAFASYGEATRAKGIIPIGWLADTEANATINQVEGKNSYTKNMQPESSTTYEYGIRYGAEGLVKEDDRLHLKLAFFDTEIENLILQVGGQRGLPVTGFYNEDPVTSKGYEAKLGWDFGGFDTNLGYTHAVAEDQNGNTISFSRRKAASAGDTLVWDNFWNLNSTLGLGYTLKYVASLDRDDIERDGYTLHNAQVVLTPSFLKGLTVTVAALNLLDEQYRSQASSGEDDTATPEPGRDIRIGMTYKVLF